MLNVRFLIDTGSWEVSLGSLDARRLQQELGIEVSSLPVDPDRYGGIGGHVDCRVVDARVWLGPKSFDVPLKVLQPHQDGEPRLPSLLGRRILSEYILIAAWPTNEVGLYLG